ncbi:unnamed protein product [Caenorhabditis auriculariae]|uniref:Uncharacterized protein n=1 Tax=Caenorhabditis auriculariae TaxID=2777116 RepID=A0A8S1GXV1_9PELO|nr:unnamed protein product [Caenorhabditis auriculariae]
MKKVTHVIFDFDGLLVDTENAYTHANRTLLSRFGKEFTMDLKKAQMGKKHDEAIVWLLKELKIEDRVTPEEYSRDYDLILNAMFEKCQALPGAEKLVRHLIKHEVPVALCTGSCSRTFPVKAKNHREWLDLVTLHVLTGDDPEVLNGKPHPDPFLVTMRRFNTAPESAQKCLVFEDSYNGALSAISAGMQCVMIPDTSIYDPDEEFRSKMAQVLPSLENFIPEEFGLPPYEN